MKLKFSDDTETSIGEISHHTAKEATYQIEEGELITEVGVSDMSYMSNLAMIPWCHIRGHLN